MFGLSRLNLSSSRVSSPNRMAIASDHVSVAESSASESTTASYRTPRCECEFVVNGMKSSSSTICSAVEENEFDDDEEEEEEDETTEEDEGDDARGGTQRRRKRKVKSSVTLEALQKRLEEMEMRNRKALERAVLELEHRHSTKEAIYKEEISQLRRMVTSMSHLVGQATSNASSNRVFDTSSGCLFSAGAITCLFSSHLVVGGLSCLLGGLCFSARSLRRSCSSSWKRHRKKKHSSSTSSSISTSSSPKKTNSASNPLESQRRPEGESSRPCSAASNEDKTKQPVGVSSFGNNLAAELVTPSSPGAMAGLPNGVAIPLSASNASLCASPMSPFSPVSSPHSRLTLYGGFGTEKQQTTGGTRSSSLRKQLQLRRCLSQTDTASMAYSPLDNQKAGRYRTRHVNDSNVREARRDFGTIALGLKARSQFTSPASRPHSPAQPFGFEG